MCIAIVKPEGTQIDDATLEHCFKGNDDGAGFAIVTPSGLIIQKGFMTFDDFLMAYHIWDVNAAHALVHFRITTRGSEGEDNCHPFALKHGALIHNGTIWRLGDVGKGKSDSQLLAEMLYEESFETIERLGPMIHEYIGQSRVAMMDHSGNSLIFNRSDWKEEDGVLFSNNNYKPWTSNFNYNRHFTRTNAGHITSLTPSQSKYEDDIFDDGKWGDSEGYSDATKTIVGMRHNRLEAKAAQKEEEEEEEEEEYNPYDFFWCDKSERLYRRTETGFFVRDYVMEKAALEAYWSYGGTTYDDLEYLTEELIREEVEKQCKLTQQSIEPSTESPFESSPTHFEATIPSQSKSMVKS